MTLFNLDLRSNLFSAWIF